MAMTVGTTEYLTEKAEWRDVPLTAEWMAETEPRSLMLTTRGAFDVPSASTFI